MLARERLFNQVKGLNVALALATPAEAQLGLYLQLPPRVQSGSRQFI